jgi:hypothetical protein
LRSRSRNPLTCVHAQAVQPDMGGGRQELVGAEAAAARPAELQSDADPRPAANFIGDGESPWCLSVVTLSFEHPMLSRRRLERHPQQVVCTGARPQAAQLPSTFASPSHSLQIGRGRGRPVCTREQRRSGDFPAARTFSTSSI